MRGRREGGGRGECKLKYVSMGDDLYHAFMYISGGRHQHFRKGYTRAPYLISH